MCEDAETHRLHRVGGVGQFPVDGEEMFFIEVFAFGGEVDILKFLRFLERLSERHRRFDLLLFERLEITIHQFEAFVWVVVAIEENERVGRVVVRLPKVAEVFVGEVGDVCGVAARVHAVDVLGEQRLDDDLGEIIIGRGICALHFVEDHTFIRQRRGRVFDLVVPAFLHESLFAEDGIEDRVDVDIDEVVEIFFVLAGDGVASFIRECEGIDESCQ